MRRVPFLLLTLLTFTTIASAQTVTPANPANPMAILSPLAAVPMNPEMVVARLMSFDSDNDGRVARSELPERMHSLLSGDAGRDEALDSAEIRALAAPRNMRMATVPGFPPSGGYGFGDQLGVSTRSHIEGALDDLRLPSSTRDRALGLVRTFMDGLEADASAVLLKELDAFVAPERLAAFKSHLEQDLSTRREPRRVFARPDGPDSPARLQDIVEQFRVFQKKGSSLATHINAFHLPAWQNRLALASLERFNARIRPDDADRAALVTALKDVLGDEERENFDAALQRRPLVKAGAFGMMTVLGDKLHIMQDVVAGPALFTMPFQPQPRVVEP